MFLCPWGSSVKNTGGGGRALLQVILPTHAFHVCLAGGFFTAEPPGKPYIYLKLNIWMNLNIYIEYMHILELDTEMENSLVFAMV